MTVQIYETKWFCETCQDTTPHSRVSQHPRRVAWKCSRCGEQFTRNYETPSWSSQRRKWKYRYRMHCTHCGNEWVTKCLRQPKTCPRCKTAHILVVGLTRDTRIHTCPRSLATGRWLPLQKEKVQT